MLEFELVLFLMIKYVLLFDLSFMDNKGIFSLIMWFEIYLLFNV